MILITYPSARVRDETDGDIILLCYCRRRRRSRHVEDDEEPLGVGVGWVRGATNRFV